MFVSSSFVIVLKGLFENGLENKWSSLQSCPGVQHNNPICELSDSVKAVEVLCPDKIL